MAVTPPPTIADPPADLPVRGDQDTFTTRFEALLGWMIPGFWNFLKAVRDNVYANAQQAEAAAVLAQAGAAAATNVAGAGVWVSGTNYGQFSTVIDPSNYQTYRRKVAGSGAVRPGLDPTNWAAVTGVWPVLTINSATTLMPNTHYVVKAAVPLTLPSARAVGDGVRITNQASAFGITVTGNGGDVIRGVAGAWDFNARQDSCELFWSGPTDGWV